MDFDTISFAVTLSSMQTSFFLRGQCINKTENLVLVFISMLLPPSSKVFWEQGLETTVGCYQETQLITASTPVPKHVIWSGIGKNRTVSDTDPFLFIVQHGCCGDPRFFKLVIHLQRYHLGVYT